MHNYIMNHSILYISSATPNITKSQIDAIMDITYRNNSKLGITGFLVYNRGNFLQLLEGNPESVSLIYKRITGDLRHRNIMTVLNNTTAQKSFEYYHSGFKIFDNPVLVEELKSYVKLIRTLDAPKHNKTFDLVEGILNSM